MIIFLVGKRNIGHNIDEASAELFADDGEISLTDIFFPGEDFTGIQFYTDGAVEIKSGAVYSLKSIWAQKN